MEGTTKQGACLYVCLWLAACLQFQLTATLLCKNWLYLHFWANPAFTLLSFSRILCLLSDTSPHLSPYDTPFCFLFYRNTNFNQNSNSVLGLNGRRTYGQVLPFSSLLLLNVVWFRNHVPPNYSKYQQGYRELNASRCYSQ